MKDRPDSDLSDVKIIRKIDDIPELKAELIAEFDRVSHVDASRYGLMLARHAMELAGMAQSDAFDACFDVCTRWQEGKAKFQEARQVAFSIHRLAREEKDPARVKALRVLGQVAATPHVKRHALIASDYAVVLVNVLHPGDMDAVRAERNAQIDMMRRAASGGGGS